MLKHIHLDLFQSIGPLHHGRRKLQAMEAYKLSCLQNFSAKNHNISVEQLVNFAAKEESYVRGCYEDTMKFSRNQFVEPIILDGIFVVELLLKSQSVNGRDKSDALYENLWMQKDVLHDMLLLENQLPVKFLRELFGFVKFEPRHEYKFDDLVCEYFKDVGNIEKLTSKPVYLPEARHLIEFLVYVHWPTQSQSNTDAQAAAGL